MKLLLVTSMKMQKKANARAPSRVLHVAEKETNFIQLRLFHRQSIISILKIFYSRN